MLVKSAYSDLTVVLPTMNEAGSVGKLIKNILDSFIGARVIVVDDGSTDGTVREIRELSHKRTEIRFIDRKALHREGGLTASVVDGIMAAKTDFVVVMDADGQHPYQLIHPVMKSLRDGNDLVICTRTSVRNWSMSRVVISKIMTVIGRAVLLIRMKPHPRDVMSGFFGVRRHFFSEVYSSNRKGFVGRGFKILFDLLKSMDREDTIHEILYIFSDRKHGASKAKLIHGAYLVKSFLT